MFLLRCHVRTGDAQYLRIVEHTLDAMARGGIYDQLGGGFHRYSVDAHWLVPHFEKMLYDNALLSRTYTEAWLLTGNARLPAHRRGDARLGAARNDLARGRLLLDPGRGQRRPRREVFRVGPVRGASPPWGATTAELFCRYFDITAAGNFEGRNILNVPEPAGSYARQYGLDEHELLERIARGRAALFRQRETRVRPGRDEKILTAWNGLMLRSFAEAANAFDRSDYREAALRNAEFILGRLHIERASQAELQGRPGPAQCVPGGLQLPDRRAAGALPVRLRCPLGARISDGWPASWSNSSGTRTGAASILPHATTRS